MVLRIALGPCAEDNTVVSEFLRPRDVAQRLSISGAGLRRLSDIYERHYGVLERDESGSRQWSELAVTRLEQARTLYKEGKAGSIEAAFALIERAGLKVQNHEPERATTPLAALAETLADIQAKLGTLVEGYAEMQRELAGFRQEQVQRHEDLEEKVANFLDELERRGTDERKQGIGSWFRTRG